MTTLGKRHRTNSSLRRTTSMSGFEVPAEEAGRQPTRAARGASAAPAPSTGWGAASAAMQRRHSGDFQAVMETAAFLKACGLCCRRLGPGRDTFIYMGEVAFCSLECRQQQMNIDELKLKDKKCFPTAGTGGSDSTVVAA